MTRKELDMYIKENASDVIDCISEIEIQDLLYGYEDDEIIKRLDEEILKLRFLNRYEDQWDYSHNMLEKGDIFYYYLKENGLVEIYKHLLTRDTFPKHISDIPSELHESYMEYLKEYLMEFWDMETWNDDSYLLEHALEEFKEQLDFEKEC